MSIFEVQILQPSGAVLEVETVSGSNTSRLEILQENNTKNIEILQEDVTNIEIIQEGINNLEIVQGVTAILPPDFTSLIDQEIVDFIKAGSGIILSASSSGLEISTSIVGGSGGVQLSPEQIDDRVSNLLKAGQYITLTYNDAQDQLVVGVTGLQPSGNYSISGHAHTTSDISGFTNGVLNSVSGIYAPLNSPSFSGAPTAPTAPSGSNSTQIANTSFVKTEINSLINGAPSGLNTLQELASAINNDVNFFSTVSSGLAQKANLSGASFAGPVAAPSGNFSILQQSGIAVSLSGHKHTYTDITNFASGIEQEVSTLLVAGNYISINYDSLNDTLTVSATGVQPSGNYSLVGHTHTSSNITDFNSSVSGLLPVKNVIGSGYIGVSGSNGNYTVFATGLQPSGNYANSIHSHAIGDVTGLQTALDNKVPTNHTHDDRYYTESEVDNLLSLKQSSGNYSIVGHSHTSSDITNFNTSVSGLLPVTNITGGTNISVVPSGTNFTVSVSGQLGLTAEEVDDRVSNLLVGGSGISLNYDDNANTLTINNTSISPDEIEEYATTSNFPASGNANILYVATNTGQLFKWDGSVYYEAGPQGASTGTHGTQHDSDGIDPIPLTEYNVPQFTANTNNLNHLNKDILYITADANNRELTGLLAPTFCCVKLLVNISSTNTIIIDNQSTNSDPANRFLIYTGADYYLLPGQSLSVLYSTEAMRWRVL